ncbi:RNA polymerase II elongation factor ELL3 [Xenopus laevis]|uniref:RNA polymerase II elongation factor ELL3 n=2 Tax=Xenopus laevis TaxID=8355 RepID=A0A1L8H0R1_XENLA|nr:RNA polymerase II elongation factor ELL3 [Xenopus laevis]OCT89684.1 hypothetical protein XELAEV_18018303mg [Xenopus laevis]
MSRPGDELLGSLPYKTEPRRSPRLSLFHLKLTDSALRCLRDFQRRQGSGASSLQPVITFQGNQGYIKIPSPSPGCEDRIRIFAFYLSRESKDKPQSSFECIRQGTTWSGEKQLSCIGSIQDKITVCATDESYQLTRDRVSQVEKETWSRTAIEIKPEASHRNKYVKIPTKNNMEASKEESQCSQRPPVFLTPAAKKCNRVSVENRPLQEWIVHLLALKPYKKQKIISRLEKAGENLREQKDLLATLDLVGKVNPKDGSYSLKEEFYTQVKTDWVGYSSEERQHIESTLSRKHLNISASRNIPTAMPAPPQRTQQGPPSSYSSARGQHSESKRPPAAESTDNGSCKKMKTSHFDSRQRDSNSPPALNSNSRHKTSPVPENHSVYSLHTHKNQSNHQSVPKSQHREHHKEKIPCEAQNSGKAKPRGGTSQCSQGHKQTEWKKEEKKQQDSSEGEEEDDDWEEGALQLERCLCSPEEKPPLAEPASPSDEIPDYCKKYRPITCADQKQVYEKDFTTDYTEYLELHAKIGKVLDHFVRLGSKMKKLQEGTVEHKMAGKKILAEYKKFKLTYPAYREEKAKCEYLHHKLSHIKELILEYEKNPPT